MAKPPRTEKSHPHINPERLSASRRGEPRCCGFAPLPGPRTSTVTCQGSSGSAVGLYGESRGMQSGNIWALEVIFCKVTVKNSDIQNYFKVLNS